MIISLKYRQVCKLIIVCRVATLPGKTWKNLELVNLGKKILDFRKYWKETGKTLIFEQKLLKTLKTWNFKYFLHVK